MKAIVRHQDEIDLAVQKGINPYDLINVYGIMFVLKLINSLIKTDKKNKFKTIPVFYPNSMKESEMENYLDRLRGAGFQITSWFEDFPDEDTGKVVEVERWKIFYLN
jgi:hypothetical protein